jgi:transposase
LLLGDFAVGGRVISFAMIRAEGIMTALTIRKDCTLELLRKLAKAETNPRVARRLLAIANALSGMSRKEVAEAAGMDRQTLSDWVIRYNAHGPDGLCDCWSDGRPARLRPDEQAELIRIGLEGSDPGVDDISAFTREDLVRICEARFGKSFHPASLGRVLKRLGFSRQKARPSHPQKDPAQAEAFKRSSGASEKNSVYA